MRHIASFGHGNGRCRLIHIHIYVVSGHFHKYLHHIKHILRRLGGDLACISKAAELVWSSGDHAVEKE